MSNDLLAEALGRLDAERASQDFTARVLARLDGSPPRPRGRLVLAGVLAGLLLAALALTAGWPPWRHAEDTAAARRQLAELQAEHRRLQEEWHDLRRAARRTEPVLYLGGNDSLDVVLDLTNIPPQAMRLEAQPAALKQRSLR